MITELVAHIKLRMILTTVVPLEPCSSTQNEYSMFNGSFTTLAALLANLSNKTALGSMAVKAAEPIIAAAQNYTQALANATGDAASTTAATVVNTTAESAVAAIGNTKAAGNYISSNDRVSRWEATLLVAQQDHQDCSTPPTRPTLLAPKMCRIP